MKNKLMKIICVALFAFAIGSIGTSAFAATALEKWRDKMSAKARHPKTVRISVSKDGFSPAQIRAEKGYEVTLVFTQSDTEGCSEDVVFTSLNIRKKLVLNKEVTIAITPKEAGEIVFECSVGKLKGSIAVR